MDLNHDPLPFPNDYFDAVFSKSVIEHITNTEHYIKEMRRVPKPGGRLVLMVPDWEMSAAYEKRPLFSQYFFWSAQFAVYRYSIQDI